ncbi:hypothetical protein Sjap_021333 [Stephania japonica]|uniref:Uncharacterized protein n=1 Tax=Stephania japonica TaxID=461633 RepID=A0AAP0HTD5_9MAGN
MVLDAISLTRSDQTRKIRAELWSWRRDMSRSLNGLRKLHSDQDKETKCGKPGIVMVKMLKALHYNSLKFVVSTTVLQLQQQQHSLSPKLIRVGYMDQTLPLCSV